MMVLVEGAAPLSLAEVAQKARRPLWAMVDGASCPAMPDIVGAVGGTCLYRADSPASAPHAPWIVPVTEDSPVLGLLGSLKNQQHWGILFSSDESERALRNHFRKFTMLWTPADLNAPVYFRFYDPRVLGDAMSALSQENLMHLFAPVLRLWVPASPLLGGWTGLSPLAEDDVFEGDFLELALPDGAAPVRPQAFRVEGGSYAEMGRLYSIRNRRKLARDLRDRFPSAPENAIVTSAKLAPEKGPQFGMDTIRQINAFADAIVVFGPQFYERMPEAGSILRRNYKVTLQKTLDFEDWFKTARAAKRAAGTTAAPGTLQ